MHVPEELRYTRNHEWLRIEGDSQGVVGITDFAQGELGDVVFVELEPAGTTLEREQVFGTVEAVKTVSELFLPVSGTIEEVNDGLESAPDAVNNDPYGAGWMIRVRMDDPSEAEQLLSATEYTEMVSA